jgi:hypothetical protein
MPSQKILFLELVGAFLKGGELGLVALYLVTGLLLQARHPLDLQLKLTVSLFDLLGERALLLSCFLQRALLLQQLLLKLSLL